VDESQPHDTGARRVPFEPGLERTEQTGEPSHDRELNAAPVAALASGEIPETGRDDHDADDQAGDGPDAAAYRDDRGRVESGSWSWIDPVVRLAGANGFVLADTTTPSPPSVVWFPPRF
jgi:hypothetical protein